MYLPPSNPSPESVKALGTEDLPLGTLLKQSITGAVEAGTPANLIRAEASQVEQEPYWDIGGEAGLSIENPVVAKPLTEQAWHDSPYWRPGLKYEPGMTENRAMLLSSDEDRKQQAAYVESHWHGFTGFVASQLGQIAGFALDPTMYLPVMGQEALAAKIGAVPARIAMGAIQNATVMGVAGAAGAETEGQLQQDPDWMGVAHNMAIAAGLGALQGTVGAMVDRVPLKQRITAAAQALDSISRDGAPDVAPVLKPQEVLQAKPGNMPESASKLDYATAIQKDTPLDVPKGAGDLGVAPDVEAKVNERYKDLMANPETAKRFQSMTEAGNQEVQSYRDTASRYMKAALCMARAVF